MNPKRQPFVGRPRIGIRNRNQHDTSSGVESCGEVRRLR